MDFLERVQDYLEALTFTPSSVDVGILEGEGVGIKPTPEGVADRHYEGSTVRTYGVQILVCNQSIVLAESMMERIAKRMDGLPDKSIVSSDDSFEFVMSEVYSQPQFIERTSSGYLFSCMVQATLYIE